MVLVVGNHSSQYLQYGSLREVNVPLIGVGAPAAKNLDKPRRYASGSCCRGGPSKGQKVKRFCSRMSGCRLAERRLG